MTAHDNFEVESTAGREMRIFANHVKPIIVVEYNDEVSTINSDVHSVYLFITIYGTL